MRLDDLELNYWHYLAMFFAAVTIVAALGEWVFHWWADPGQYVAGAGFVLTVLSLGFAASKFDVRRMGRRFDRMERGQDALIEGQRALIEGQQRLLEGQQRLLEGQERQTHLLEQVCSPFAAAGSREARAWARRHRLR